MFENDQHHKSKKSEKVKRESEKRRQKKNATRHKSKQMFCSLKRTAKIPPNGLIKWQELAFFFSPLQQGSAVPNRAQRNKKTVLSEREEGRKNTEI